MTYFSIIDKLILLKIMTYLSRLYKSQVKSKQSDEIK